MTWLGTFTGLSGASAVALGAFGAHALKDKLNAHQTTSWSTATKYQLIHTAVLLFITSVRPLRGANKFAAYAFATGIVLFSGSIYGLCLLPAGHGLRKLLGPATPLGGLSFIAGWLALAYARVPVTL
ncbi:hypothetical protein ACI68E_002780 [Malassezia pachydermatis]|uniref:DUF423-domain-containing protein n=1 Tax=Malassezia pachydermatis TaxID=77020 RepID=A0A0M8MYX8_9BASI|nr:hypothetical protein Malapachy_3613 [Malassezia pachydermatis]KOS16341.1 hypothetical protein Malapachy_3613 [Malassezia pachydermatis]